MAWAKAVAVELGDQKLDLLVGQVQIHPWRCSGEVSCEPLYGDYLATTMFVRFRQSARRLQASLIETRREGGKVRHEHVAGLGTLPLHPNLSDRIEFWQNLFGRLERLANRLDDETRNKIV